MLLRSRGPKHVRFDIELRPALVEPGNRRRNAPDGGWADPTPDGIRVLKAYRTPPDIPLATATLVRFAGREFTADLTEDEISQFFTLSEAIAFAGLSNRNFFQPLGYYNRDSFPLIAQRFLKDQGGVALVLRRRDGSKTVGIPEQFWVARKEPHIEVLSHFDLDSDLAALVLSEMDRSEDFDRAIRSFNEGNTDRPSLSEAQELISMVSAFQRLLGERSGDEGKTRRAFVTAMSKIPAAGITPKKTRAAEKLPKRPGGLREVWTEDLCVLRGSVGHGHDVTAYPSVWTSMEHLLLAAHIFPLLVKLKFADAGKRSLTTDEKLRLALFDLFLASGNVLGADRDQYGIPTRFEWNSICLEGQRQRLGDW